MSRYLFSLVVIFLFLATSCESEKQQLKIPDPSTAMIQKADNAIKMLGGQLKKNLLTQMSGAGVDSAIAFCSLQAMPLTDEVNHKLKGFSVKRTSLKIRNPLNAPDSLETVALKYYASVIANGEPLPPNYLQKFVKNGHPVYRFYTPVKVGGLCLNCHGSKEKMAASVIKTLEEKYPYDQATGYKEGDFRGLMRVEFYSN